MTRLGRPVRIAVIGASAASGDEYEIARAVGSRLASAGAVVVCGGRGGVMEGVARGACEAGGEAVGILPGNDPGEANEWIRLPIATGMGDARNALVAQAGEAVLAIGGAWGTLSEIALARTVGRDVGLLGTPPAEGLGLPRFEDPHAAVDWALERARARRTM